MRRCRLDSRCRAVRERRMTRLDLGLGSGIFMQFAFFCETMSHADTGGPPIRPSGGTARRKDLGMRLLWQPMTAAVKRVGPRRTRILLAMGAALAAASASWVAFAS